MKALVPPAESERTRTGPRWPESSWARARAETATWSVAVLDPVLPCRRIAASGVPVPPVPWSANAKVASMSTMTCPSTSDRGPPGQQARRCPGLGAGGDDSGDCDSRVAGESVDDPRHRRIGRDHPEQVRAGPQHHHVRGAVPARGEPHRKIADRLARKMNPGRPGEPVQLHGQRLHQAQAPGGLR